MTLKDYVPTVETCKKLQVAGIEFSESYLVWFLNCDNIWSVELADDIDILHPSLTDGYRYPAPLFYPEIVEKLPKYIPTGSLDDLENYYCYELFISRGCLSESTYQIGKGITEDKEEWDWCLKYRDGMSEKRLVFKRHTNLAEASAQMLLWLRENKYI